MAAFIQVKNLFCYPLDKILFFDNKVSKNLITKKKKISIPQQIFKPRSFIF